MIVGLCHVFSVVDVQLVAYACQTYELAHAQALELLKGVDARVERYPERVSETGLRETAYRVRRHGQLIHVREVEVGTSVLPVDGDAAANIVEVPWPT